jgi:hypothetical protein
LKLPDQEKIRIYPHVQNVYVGWAAFAAAVKARKNHVIHEIWKIRRGRRGKGLHELQEEYALLKAKGVALLKNIGKASKGHNDEDIRQQLIRITAAMEQIRRKIEKDYGVSLHSG